MLSLEQEFHHIIDGQKPDNLYNPILYILEQPGKRIRPQLVNMSVNMFEGSTEQAKKVAMAFEMLHNFTLIHDDIMDEAPIRRGKETVYKKWNSNIAILSGDALAIMALQQLLDLKCDERVILAISNVFAQTSLEICEGQQYDLDFETQEKVSIDEYINMIRKKTAVMFAGCLKAGAILAQASQQDQQTLYDFGIHLGIAFQLADDVLDVYASAPVFGKAIGGDIRDNKKTYLYLKALEDANLAQKETLESLFSTQTSDFEKKYNIVRGIYDELNIKTKTEELEQHYLNLCMSDLEKINVSEDKKEPFNAIVQKMINREK